MLEKRYVIGMGIYVNPGNVSFGKAIKSKIYIDKTELIKVINDRIDTSDCFMCVSRPRRFGKSMAADMLVAYYSRGCNSHILFKGKKIAGEPSYEIHLNQHSVIRLDIQRFLFDESHLDIFIDEIQERVIQELREEYGDRFPSGPYGLPGILEQIHAHTGDSFIFIVDEWDCVFRIAKERKEIQKKYLDFLRGLFKGAEYVDLAYMTGILPIKKYGEHSAINIFSEYSVIEPKDLGEYFGFTEDEVGEQCRERGIDYEEMKKWYDGYQLNELLIYNPKSVVDALIWKDFQSYWTGTETYEALKIYIDLNFDGLKEAIIKMLGNGRCRINTRKFQNDMTTFKTRDDVLTLLVHLGYLTYDRKTGETFIPNQEIAQEFRNAIEGPSWDGVIRSLDQSADLLECTWKMDEKAVADHLEVIHNETTSILKYNDENSLTCVILMAYYSAQAYYMKPIMELPSGRGLADVVYLPKRNVEKPALIIELKWKKSPEGAIRQIREKQYSSWLENYTGDILLVGINYDDGKGHTCMIEKYKIG